jgi:hypothetical protein
MAEGTKVVRFLRAEKYLCAGTLHVYPADSVHRFDEDFADRMVSLQLADYAEGFERLPVTARPEPGQYPPGVIAWETQVIPEVERAPEPVVEAAKPKKGKKAEEEAAVPEPDSAA